MSKKSIIINERSHKELKKLAREYNRNIGKFTEEMILYFQKTGTDPQAIKGKNATEMIKVIDRRIVSFFKTQESEILYPIHNQLLKNGKRTETLFNKLIDQLNTVFERMKYRN